MQYKSIKTLLCVAQQKCSILFFSTYDTFPAKAITSAQTALKGKQININLVSRTH